MIRRILLVLLLALVAIQFFRPTRNNGTVTGPNDFTKVVQVPEQVMTILNVSCMDCHSNHTEYPWYTNIQPIGWWMQHHVDEGREELNFSEFKNYPVKKQKHKLHECEEMIEENEMPLSSYTMMHSDAVLNETQKKVLIDWIHTAMASLGEDASAE